MNPPNIIISGGGTGGHIFPAISIANAIKEIVPESKILFVGAEGRMEMTRVPEAGYSIVGLPVKGFNRKNILKNISVLFDLWKSMQKARKIIKEYKPDIAIGVGGYASGPTLKEANKLGIPTLLQEQNSYAGVTNKLLAQKATAICVAYENMEKFFPAEKIILTGNPVRQGLVVSEEKQQTGYAHFGLDPSKKTILIVGGSLGARTINQSVLKSLNLLKDADIQVIWQTGKYYYGNLKDALDKNAVSSVKMMDFISRMDLAYSVADLIISRAGAGSISEFCLVGKPVILVPSPNVAEDHQTKNALALVKKDAAVLIKDGEAEEKLIETALTIIHDNDRLRVLGNNILKLAQRDSAKRIAEKVLEIINLNK
ncbi:MAG: undecaprenyldiphospho-muramoylpentapeptide beta-N-acetylglucosaminyltransferase [Candidatus Azobacteroides sp.]|nr:undecaprenyldiphospho-muramoylpentapeptide beta-N-acetylglucosaminyltransferase [Candidatus Azobacteroides sp.]